MKKISIIILLFCISISLHSQILFNKIYNPNNTWAAAFNVFPVDSGYVSCGTMGDSINGLTNIVVSKYDIYGNQILFREYKNDSFYCFAGSFSGGGLAKCKNGGFAISATQTDYTKSKVILIRLNNNLDTLWTKTIMDDTVQFNTKHCIETTDRGFAMCGEKMVYNPSERSVVLFCKTDSMGNKLFEKYYDITLGANGHRWDAGWNITETPDKGFLLGCSTYDYAYQGTGDGIVIKTDSLGNLAWMKNFGGPEGDVGLVTAVCNDGNYMIASEYSYYTAPYNAYWKGKIRLTKITPDGYTIWMKEYFGVTYGMAVIGIHALDDGSFIFGGTKSYNNEEDQGLIGSYLFKVNANGDSNWCKEYLYPVTGNCQVAWNAIKTFEITPDSGIVACGEIFYNTILPNNIWIFRTNEHGCLIQGCDVGINEISKTKGEIKIFPNPAKDYTIVSYTIEAIQLKEAGIEIYDAMGRLINKINISALTGQQMINCTTYSNGQYIAMLKNNGKTINTVKFNIIH